MCTKVNASTRPLYSPDRIATPLRRAGAKGDGRFVPISWPEALDEIVGRWQAIIREDGPLALLGYAYSAHQGQINRGLLLGLFHALGVTRLQAGTVCDSCAEAGWDAACGSVGGADPETVVHSDLVIAWGADLMTTNLHIWPLVERARRAGAKVVVIEPRRSQTAERADWHVRVNVGSDAALALGLMHVLARDGLCDRDYLARKTLGFERLEREVLPRSIPPAWPRSPACRRPTSSGSRTCTAARGRLSSGSVRGCRAPRRVARPFGRWRSCRVSWARTIASAAALS